MNMLFKMETGIGEANFDVEMEQKIVVPENQVYDNVGHGNPRKEFNGWKQGGGQIDIAEPNTIYIDTVAPTATYDTITGEGCFKEGTEIKGKLGFSEEMRPGKIKYKFGNNGTIAEANYNTDSNNYIALGKTIEFSTTVKSGENGKMQLDISSFTDLAGNGVAKLSDEKTDYKIYADTTPPTVEATSNNLGQGMIEYTFILKDNSDDYEVANKGIASNTFTLEDITISNGTIMGSTSDAKGNIKTIKVSSNQDGNQRVYVGIGKFSDVAGNLNNEDYICTTVVDTKPPQIYTVEKS